MNLRRKTKELLKVWSRRLLFAVIGVLVFWANVHRFCNNTFSNYEKAVDYGRVRENKESIEPVIAAIFYEKKNSQKETLSSYLDHSANYRRENVRIIAVPTNLTRQGEEVVETLYKELSQKNKLNKIFLIKNNTGEVYRHKELLRQNIKGNPKIVIKSLEDFSDNVLDDPGVAAVFPTDMNSGIVGDENFELIAEIARRRNYKTHVFDVIDTEIAGAVGKNYSELFVKNVPAENSKLIRQKNNLSAYKKNYEAALLNYFRLNFKSSRDGEAIWPEKNSLHYRLYDRGNIYVRFFGDNNQELFSRAKIGKNKGIVVSLVEVALKALKKINKRVKYVKIYLLTDMEPLGSGLTEDVIDYLDDDDGIYVRYKEGIKALMVSEEIADNKETFTDILRRRAKIPPSAKNSEIKLYKFKTVEMEYEN